MEPGIGSESRFLHILPAFDALLRGGGSRLNIAITYGMEKLEWCSYPVVKFLKISLFRQNVRT